MQHPIGEHALLADGRTAALIDPLGSVVWLCWPRVDSMPVLFGLLDEQRGGVFSLRPQLEDAAVVARRYHTGTLVLETTWQVARSRVTVDDALVVPGPPRLVCRLRCDGDPVDMAVRWAPSPDAGRARVALRVTGRHAEAASGDLRLLVTSPGDWEVGDGVVCSRFSAVPGEDSFVVLENARDAGGDERARHLLDATMAVWARLAGDGPPPLSAMSVRSLGEVRVTEMLAITRSVLLGLTQRGGGIVAAPTTSLPQWHGTSRTWDYRYCWLRDAALAATAMLRVGCTESASALGEFIGGALAGDAFPSLVRVDGAAPPGEETLPHLDGYRGARPVRIGNAAAHQLQLDITGEVSQLAVALAGADALPGTLATACGRLAARVVDHWQDADHGIWEVRGGRRHYTHSRVMAWVALRDAVSLAERGLIRGDSGAWRRCAGAIHREVIGQPRPLQLHAEGGGADAALAAIPMVGFLPVNHPAVHATLDMITRRLDRRGLLDRYEGRPDCVDEPCGPFLFPTFWLATALEMCGRQGDAYFTAAAGARGDLSLFGEVADPSDGSVLGNYPQVQSHAAFALCATQPAGAALTPRW